MIQLTSLLLISFIIQIIGYFFIRNNFNKKAIVTEGETFTFVKKGLNLILGGLFIQLIVIISQILIYFLFVKKFS